MAWPCAQPPSTTQPAFAGGTERHPIQDSRSTQMLDQLDGTEIAIIGMVGRFPGAATLDQFWQNLRDGVESITLLTDDELRTRGVEPALLADPTLVKAAAVLDDMEWFDAAFFGISH